MAGEAVSCGEARAKAMARSGANMVVPLTARSLSAVIPRINLFGRMPAGCSDFTIRATGRGRYSFHRLENPK